MVLIKNKLTKIIAMFLVTVFIINSISMTVSAESVMENEPNNTRETAETITANNETPSDTLSGSHTGEHVVEGTTTQNDPDWFKVYLNAGTNYMTCNGDAFDFVIENSNGNIISTGSYSKTGFGPTAYEFTASAYGYYYVEIIGTTSSYSRYLFLIGSPTYSLSSCTVPCREGTISMISGGGAQTGHFDAGSLSGIPEDAIAYTVRMSGLGTTNVSSVRLINDTDGYSISLDRYTWSKDNLVSMNMPVASTWTASFGYNNKAVSFTPTLTIYYVYPVYSSVIG